MKKQEFKKLKRGLGTSRTTLNTPISELQGSQKEKRKSKKFESLFEQIMKENFPSLAKEIDFQEVQEAQRVPKKLDLRKHTARHIIITLAKIEDKERILKTAREKGKITYKGVPIRLSADFSKKQKQKTCRQEGAGKKYLKS